MPGETLRPLSRRVVLEMLGLGGGLMLPSLSRAGPTPIAPKRLVVFYSYHGVLKNHWSPTGTETDFTLGETIADLSDFKRDLILLDGLKFQSYGVAGNNPGNAHQQGHYHALSGYGSHQGNASITGGVTIDQYIAQNLQPPVGGLRSLNIGVNDSVNFPSYHWVSTAAAGDMRQSEADPARVWDALFKGYTPPSGMGPIVPAVDAQKKRDKSVLDFVKLELDAARKVVCASDGKRIDAHAQAIRDVENRLGLVAGPADPPTAVPSACQIPTRAGGGNFKQNLDLQIKLTQLALLCDRTRVVTFNVEELSNSAAGISGDLHDMLHRTAPNGADRNNQGEVDKAKVYYKTYTRAYRDLLKSLAGATDIDGKRVLDNSTVLWAGEISDASHSYTDMKWILAGGLGGQFRTGRWLQCGNAPHQNLFVSLAQTMGVPNVSSFGRPQSCTGPLAGLR